MRKRARQDDSHPDLFSPRERVAIVPAELSQTASLDEHFARLMTRLDGRGNTAIATAARMASAWRSSGHICVPMSALAQGNPGIAEALASSPVVGGPGEWTPLILDSERLYLQRYWQYERRLADAIVARTVADGGKPLTVEDASLAATILGPDAADQLLAVRTALTRPLSIITGGPGTGKTRTAAAILVIDHQRSLREGTALRVTMAAPTGKAAARLTESVRATLQAIGAPPALHELRAITLHRLLGTRPDSPAPRYHAEHPLAVDLVIVDEASMIDLATMAKLLQAVPPKARLVLLGDRDQLASVDAGHVLGDLCMAAQRGALPGVLVDLRRTYRFAEGSGIGAFSAHLKSCNSAGALQALESNAADDLASVELPSGGQLSSALKARVLDGFRTFATAATPDDAVNALTRFCILGAVRRGPFGVQTLSRTAELILQKEGLIDPSTTQYPHRPIMVLSNEYSLQLFNGDVGVIMPDPESGGDLRAFFRGSEGALRKFLPARLPEHETVWAMTIHKSQGSEYERVLVILPDRDGPTLNRELIYTAVSRARRHVEVWHRPDVLRIALERTVDRTSGLPEAIVRGAGNALGAPPVGS
ncbi:MAG: exodeoxyribonuclease V subunit alpha [Chthoniobacteraceae bacterium]